MFSFASSARLLTAGARLRPVLVSLPEPVAVGWMPLVLVLYHVLLVSPARELVFVVTAFFMLREGAMLDLYLGPITLI